MAHKILLVAFSMIVATSSVSAAQPEPVPIAAPTGSVDTKYCLHVDPFTGSNIETIQCWTRDEWAEQDVDVDQAWARDGVKVIG
jgi:hypothetical protein